MRAKFGPGYAEPAQFEALIERHHNWHVKRYNGHRWEVRTGIKDNTYYGLTLHEAFCYALLETI